jgi:hypothetical protein
LYCQYCGGDVNDAVRFCTACGKAIPRVAPPGAPQSPEQKLRSHLKIMGVLWIVYSAFHILAGLWAFAILRIVVSLIANAINQQGNVSIPAGIPSLFNAIYAFAFAYGLITGAAGLIAAWGLLQHKSWGRILAIVIVARRLHDGYLVLLWR